eukprot:TRINITY_DN7875_c2_g1_i1.p1 TRINITY_DN7875_c2_g1~~TRINITY_DN7875_c2_g1_i1.p1  ORF type:complete len:981 (-),score=88.04 TRINITY_DN7875_c2_g1_i1:99-2981(-)
MCALPFVVILAVSARGVLGVKATANESCVGGDSVGLLQRAAAPCATTTTTTTIPVQCRGFLDLNFNLFNFSRYPFYFSDDSTCELAQAGINYEPARMEEYAMFLTSISPYKTLFEPVAVTTFYGSWDGRVCSFYRYAAADLTADPSTTAAAYKFRATSMTRLEYAPLDAVISTLALYFPPDVTQWYYETMLDSDNTRKYVCKTLKDACPLQWKNNSFQSIDECIQELAKLPIFSNGMRFDGHDQACRATHAVYVYLGNDLHCPALSITPMPDALGQLQCQVSKNFSTSDFWSKLELDNFQAWLDSNGIPKGIEILVDPTSAIQATSPVLGSFQLSQPSENLGDLQLRGGLQLIQSKAWGESTDPCSPPKGTMIPFTQMTASASSVALPHTQLASAPLTSNVNMVWGGSCFATEFGKLPAWWKVTLDKETRLKSLKLTGRDWDPSIDDGRSKGLDVLVDGTTCATGVDVPRAGSVVVSCEMTGTEIEIRGNQDYYLHYERSCVAGHNIVLYTGKTVEECKTICTDYGSSCMGFEFGVAYGGAGGYNPGDCQLSSSATSIIHGCFEQYGYSLDFYKRGQRDAITLCGFEAHQETSEEVAARKVQKPVSVEGTYSTHREEWLGTNCPQATVHIKPPEFGESDCQDVADRLAPATVFHSYQPDRLQGVHGCSFQQKWGFSKKAAYLWNPGVRESTIYIGLTSRPVCIQKTCANNQDCATFDDPPAICSSGVCKVRCVGNMDAFITTYGSCASYSPGIFECDNEFEGGVRAREVCPQCGYCTLWMTEREPVMKWVLNFEKKSAALASNPAESRWQLCNDASSDFGADYVVLPDAASYASRGCYYDASQNAVYYSRGSGSQVYSGMIGKQLPCKNDIGCEATQGDQFKGTKCVHGVCMPKCQGNDWTNWISQSGMTCLDLANTGKHFRTIACNMEQTKNRVVFMPGWGKNGDTYARDHCPNCRYCY